MGIQDGLLGWASSLGWLRRPETPSNRLSRHQKVSFPVRESQVPLPDIIHLEGSEPTTKSSLLELNRPQPFLGLMPTPGGSQELRDALYQHDLAKWATASIASIASMGGFLATHGATGAFQAIADAFIHRGDSVVVCDPGCPMHTSILGQSGAKIRHLGVQLDSEGALEFSPTEMARMANGAKILVLSQPNNPDGGLWSAKTLDELKWWAKRNELLVIIDESHADYIPLKLRAPSEWRSGWNGMALFVGSLSKSHPQAGTKVGWIQGPENLMQAIAQVIHNHGSGISWAAEKATLRLLSTQGVSGDFLNRMTDTRIFAENQLQGLGMRPAPSKAGMFLWMPTWNLSASSKSLAKTWKSACQVSVAPGENFGPFSMGHIRLNLAADQGRLFEGLNRLKAWSEGEMRLNNGTHQTRSVKKAA